MTHEKKSRETATESLGTLLNNGEPDLRREVLKHLDDKEFMRACLLSQSTVTANMHELLLRIKTAEEECDRHYKEAEEVLEKGKASPTGDFRLLDSCQKSVSQAVQHHRTLVRSLRFLLTYSKIKEQAAKIKEQAAKIKEQAAEINQLQMKVIALKRLYAAK